MSTSPDRTPQRYSAKQVRTLDLRAADPRLVWAESATASSEWSSSYSAATVCGAPTVFPKLGDHPDTWLANSDDVKPYLDVTFPSVPTAAALIVCETCNPGSVVSVRDLDSNIELLRADQTVPKRKGAQLLVVPLDPTALPPRRVRLTLAGHKSDYEEIDAVGLITEPMDVLLAAPPAPPPPIHTRYAPKDVPIHDLQKDPRLMWARAARASSSYSSDYEAKEAKGRPNVFPKGGDHYKTWLSTNEDRKAWLELDFTHTNPCHGVIVLEICAAGSTVRLTDQVGDTLWEAPHEDLPSREARLLHVPFDPPRPIEKVRLWMSPKVDDYREIDAVALLSVPFEELRTAAPEPPPPPPVPGAPEAGFTFLEGVLLGPTPALPLAHLALRTEQHGHALNHAGEVRLQLDGGRELTLEIDDTTVYGRPFPQRSGSFRALAEELPWLRERLGERAPGDDEPVTLVGRQLVGGERVFVAGTPSKQAATAGFRESAGLLDRLVAKVVSDTPLADTPFITSGTDEFRRHERPERPTSQAAHPLARMQRVASVLLAVFTVLFSVLAVLASRQPVEGALAAGFVATLALALFWLVLTLEFAGRSATIVLVPGSSGRWGSGRVRFTDPAWTAVGVGIMGTLSAMFSALAVGTMAGDVLALATRFALAEGGVLALVRVALWQWADRSGTVTALPILFARPGRLGSGARGRFTGSLGQGARTHEQFTAHSKYLGTTQTRDEQGRVTTYDRYKEWQTRAVSSDVTEGAELFLPDGTLLRAGRIACVVDAEASPAPPNDSVYARFEGKHLPGEAVSFLGVSRQVEGGWVVDECRVLLGGLPALRREAMRHLGALAGLLALVALGALAVLLDGPLP